MRIPHLYIKILICFVGVLSITLLLILALFSATEGKNIRDHLDNRAFVKIKAFQQLVQERIDGHPGVPLSGNPQVQKLIHDFSDLFEVDVWVTGPEEAVHVKTFPGQAKIPRRGFHRQIRHEQGITLYHFVRKWSKYYAVMPIRAPEGHLRMHLYYDTRSPHAPEWFFLLGIGVIGVVAALLVIPVSRFITRRINRLNQSALDFANGNLACRTDIRGHDEIAKLGHSFNFMADKLEKLIQNGKELTANVSHELRSPLARLMVSAELIGDKLGTPTAEKDIPRYLERIEQEIQNLDTLVNHMLALSKMDYQESDLSPEPFDFEAFSQNILTVFYPLADKKQVKLEHAISGPIPVTTDPTVVRAVLTNLLDNAIHYTQQGGKIILSAQSLADGGVEFSLANTCDPLTEEELSRIFKPFYRRQGQAGPGTGLGLTITARQVRRCNGRIWAENGEKTLIFRVRLPALPVA